MRSANAGDLLVSISVKPNQPGVNFVTAGVFDSRRPAPAPIRAVDFSIARSGGSAWLKGTKTSHHTWEIAGSHLERSGVWSIGLRIRRPGLPEQVVKVPWTLPKPGPQALPVRTVLSRSPLAPILTPIAGGGAIALAVLLLLLLLRPLWRRVVFLRLPKLRYLGVVPTSGALRKVRKDRTRPS